MKQKAGVSELLRAYGTIFAGILIVIVFSVMRPDAFFTMGNLVNITRQISLLVIIALGATLVMSVEEFDLSVGALASLGGVIGAKMAVAGAPIFLCFIAPVVICFAIGFVNGWIVTKFRVLSFITTLAMSTILGGFTFWFTGGATVFQDIPKSFTYVGTKTVLGAPILSIIMLLLTVVFWFVMRHTAFGRKLYAIGGNEAASQVSGINVKKYKNLAFALCASLAALTGVLMASRLGSAHPTGGGTFRRCRLQGWAAGERRLRLRPIGGRSARAQQTDQCQNRHTVLYMKHAQAAFPCFSVIIPNCRSLRSANFQSLYKIITL